MDETGSLHRRCGENVSEGVEVIREKWKREVFRV
jgi:hypothetical protein